MKVMRVMKVMKAEKAAVKPGEVKKYLPMYYKNNNSIGIRRGYGLRNQVFAFAGAKCELGKPQLWDLGLAVCRKLEKDEFTYDEAKKWATDRLRM